MAVTTQIATKPAEQGSAIVTCSFTDELGVAVIPNAGTLKWTLTDVAGNVINSRNQVALTSAATAKVALDGLDLAYTPTGWGRYILFECEYDSTDGAGLNLKAQGYFDVEVILAIRKRA